MNIHPSWKIEPPENSHIRAMLSYPLGYYQKRLQKIGFCGKKTKLLDAGCGSGIWAIAASSMNARVDGIDATAKYLAVAKAIKQKLDIRNLKLEIGKLEKLPYPDEYFDYLICYDAWMYTDKKESLKEMYRVLKPSGKIYLGCIAGLGWYLNLLIQGLKKGNRGLIIKSLDAIRKKIHVYRRVAEDLIQKQGFQIIGTGADGEIGDRGIKVKPLFPLKKFGFLNVYEVLAMKPAVNSKFQTQNAK